MKILCKQRSICPSLTELGISECCFKSLRLSADKHLTTRKPHRHSGFEMHFITKGHQIYEIGGDLLTIREGEMLVVSPNVLHRMTEYDGSAEKLALSFSLSADSPLLPTSGIDFLADTTPENVASALLFAEKESRKSALSAVLCENRLLEAIVLLLRMLGINEPRNAPCTKELPVLLTIAKQYISDNIEHAPTLGELAEYCHISEKQLSRIFLRHEGITAFDFIRLKRAEHARKLVADKSLSLRNISERMRFASEYYFNKFFKENCGLPPGAYRKMI